MWKNLPKNRNGFSLTEVIIGIMILTIAIVAASSLLVGLVRTNENNLRTMQAYYFAQEGIEGVRNIRDTSWLHNRDWIAASPEFWQNTLNNCGLSSGSLPCPLALQMATFNQSVSGDLGYNPAAIQAAISANAPLRLSGDGEIDYVTGEDSGFTRTITIKPYPCLDTDNICVSGHEDDYILVESKVTWAIGSQDHEVTLFEVLTNWKGGAL